jgi:hypothetical protein
MDRIAELEAQAAAKGLHQGVDAAAVAALKGLLSLVRREAPQLSGKVLGDAESAIAALQAAPPLNPVEPGALHASIRELDAWESRADGNELTPSESESVVLVLHELKRLQAAPPAPPAVPVLYVSPAQLEKHLDLEGAENAEAGRYLPARKTPAGKFTQPLYALAAAPAQAWPSECDSPELCRVHRGCAGQYGTKKTCHSLAVLNPCNPAAPAQAVAVTEGWAWVPRNPTLAMMCAAVGPMGRREMFRNMVDAAPADAPAAPPAQEHATQLAGQCGEQDEGLAQAIDERDTAEGWADGLAGLIGAYFGQDIGEHSSAHNPWQEAKDIIEEAEPYRSAAAPAQAQEDARDAVERAERYEDALRHIAENAFANKDWTFAQLILNGHSIDAARAAQGGAA